MKVKRSVILALGLLKGLVKVLNVFLAAGAAES